MTGSFLDFSEYPCLVKRMEEDEKAGKFDFTWPISSDKSRRYLESLLGRDTQDNDSVSRDFDEIERKLEKE